MSDNTPAGWISLTDSEKAVVKGLLEAARSSPEIGAQAASVLEKIQFMEENAESELAGAYYAAALHEEEEGRLEIDSAAVVSMSGEGAYVMAWLFISESDIEKPEEEEAETIEVL